MPEQSNLLFDEEWYLSKYPDVGTAVSEGRIPSALWHYSRIGIVEGRLPAALDEEFYRNSYPLVQEEIDSGMAGGVAEHFTKIGLARGYLPNPKAYRPDFAANQHSRFGGIWVDQPNALDLVDGKLEIGAITEEESDWLKRFIRNGFVIIKNLISEEVVESALNDLNKIYAGGMPEVKFECFEVSNKVSLWSREMNEHPAKALDAHIYSAAIRDLILCKKLTRFLGVLFDARPLASQTLTFLRGSAQDAHQDSAYVAYTLPRNFAASWIALEDVTPNAGELFYYPGSHRFDDFTYNGFKSTWEARRHGAEGQALSKMIKNHVAGLPRKAERRGLQKETFLAKKGDVLIWHAELAHGGSPVSQSVTRKSVVTHYCPRFSVPLFLEGVKAQVFAHEWGYYTSGVYKL